MKTRVKTFDNNKYSHGYNKVFERDHCLLKEKKVIYFPFDVKTQFNLNTTPFIIHSNLRVWKLKT